MQENGPNNSPTGTLRQLPANKKKETILITVIALVVVGLGIFTGKGLAGGGSTSSVKVDTGAQQNANGEGIADESTFSDSVEGVLKEGGMAGEGTHHLERAGGPSQNVYLTSTVIDLQSYVGKEVVVWGETVSAQKAGWLMDVGRVKAK